MKTILFIVLVAAAGTPALAQQPLRYSRSAVAVWVDDLINPQLPKSSFYLLGTGLRGEVSWPLRHSASALFAQVGYGRFFQKSTSAFVANMGLVNFGYRYQSRKAFTASLGVGAQYWRERMRVRFPEYTLDETFNNLLPSATVGIGFRIGPRTTLGLENRVLFKPEPGALVLRNNLALSVGYKL